MDALISKSRRETAIPTAQGNYSSSSFLFPTGSIHNQGDDVPVQVNTMALVNYSFYAFPIADFDGDLRQGVVQVVRPGFITEWNYNFIMPDHDVYLSVEIYCFIDFHWILDQTINWKIKLGEPLAYEVILHVSPEDSGYITTKPDLDEFPINTLVEFTAHPYEGYEFDHWAWGIYGESTYLWYEETLQFTVNGPNYYVTAFFSEIPPPPEYHVNVTIHPTDAGYVVKDPDLPVYYPGEDGKYEVTLWFYANEGYELDYWELYPGRTGESGSVHFEGNFDLDVHVYFIEAAPPEHEGTLISYKLKYEDETKDIPVYGVPGGTKAKLVVVGRNDDPLSEKMRIAMSIYSPYEGLPPPPTYSFNQWSPGQIASGGTYEYITPEFELNMEGEWKVFISLDINEDDPFRVDEYDNILCYVGEVLPEDYELKYEKLYEPEASNYKGEAEICTMYFTGAPEELPGMDTITTTIAAAVSENIVSHGGKMLRLRIYQGKGEWWNSKWKVEAIIHASPFPWAVVVPLIVALLIVIGFAFIVYQVKTTDWGKVASPFLIAGIIGIGVIGLGVTAAVIAKKKSKTQLKRG